jgi:hypothetical protein
LNFILRFFNPGVNQLIWALGSLICRPDASAVSFPKVRGKAPVSSGGGKGRYMVPGLHLRQIENLGFRGESLKYGLPRAGTGFEQCPH